MKNIILNIIGQRVLSNILLEKKDILRMDILCFDHLDHYIKNAKGNIISNIIITDFSNFKLIEHSNLKITNHIFYVTNIKNNHNVKTKFQKFDIIKCPFNLKNFIEKIKLVNIKTQFADNSKVDLLDYVINLNTREITRDKNKMKLTEREKDFLIFLKNSKKPQTKINILKSVWGYSKEMETHTIETHVHRLRKKFMDFFNDGNFIKYDKNGYYI